MWMKKVSFLFNIVEIGCWLELMFSYSLWSNNNWRNKNVIYDSFSIALMIAFDALNRLNKLVYDIFEYVQCFDLDIWTSFSCYFPKKRVRKSLIFIKNRYLSPSGKCLRVTLQKNKGRKVELFHFLTWPASWVYFKTALCLLSCIFFAGLPFYEEERNGQTDETSRVVKTRRVLKGYELVKRSWKGWISSFFSMTSLWNTLSDNSLPFVMNIYSRG